MEDAKWPLITFVFAMAGVIWLSIVTPPHREVLICHNAAGKELFRSEPSRDIRYPEREDGWRVNGGVYTPPPGSMCKVYTLSPKVEQ